MVDIREAGARIFQDFNTALLKEIDESPPPVWMEFGMEVPSSSKSTLHAWLADQAVVREWLGPRVINGMGSLFWEVFNRQFELSYGFERNQIEDDLSSLMAMAIQRGRSMARKWNDHKEKLMAETLEAGLTSPCFDGQFFFDTDHPVDLDGITSGTFSNKLTSSALNHANFGIALRRLRSFKKVDGSPMINMAANIKLVVPVALEHTAEQIVSEPYITPGAAFGLASTTGPSPNIYRGKAKVVVNPWLTSDTRWYLTAEVFGMKPLLFQLRRDVETEERGPGTDLWFEQQKIVIGSDARYEASYALPQLAIAADQ